MEKNYNYLARQYGMMGKEMLEKGDIQIAPERGYEYKICKEAYLDPDDKNYELYRDWVEYLRKRIPEVEFSLVTAPADKGMGSIEIHASVDGKTFILGSDYIGPSKFYTAKTLLEKSGKTLVQTQDYMVDMLNVTRRFSGHLVWPRGVIINGIRFPYGPRGANSINMSRGGSFGVFDRVDVSFYLLKKYFEIFIENDNEELKKKPFDMRAYYFVKIVEKKISKCKNGFRIFNIFTAFEMAESWLRLFCSFSHFAEVFQLGRLADVDTLWAKEERSEAVNDLLYGYLIYADECTKRIAEREEILFAEV